jgi:hypothetical protein
VGRLDSGHKEYDGNGRRNRRDVGCLIAQRRRQGDGDEERLKIVTPSITFLRDSDLDLLNKDLEGEATISKRGAMPDKHAPL